MFRINYNIKFVNLMVFLKHEGTDILKFCIAEDGSKMNWNVLFTFRNKDLKLRFN